MRDKGCKVGNSLASLFTFLLTVYVSFQRWSETADVSGPKSVEEKQGAGVG